MDEVPTPIPPQAPQQPVQPVPALTPEQAAALLGKPMICPRCHFAVKPEYYYCPNCGAKLTEPPIGTGLLDQLLLYAFSIILPWIAYLAITKWQGIKYLRSPDTRARQIGIIATGLLVVSSIIAFWMTYNWIQSYVQQSLSDVNNLGSSNSF